MKAIILAAGRGERMRPLTDNTPKPLLKVAGKCLIDYHIEALVKAGITDIVINLAYLGEQIKNHVGDGENYQANIEYSQEFGDGLETAGGILNALPILGAQPFLVVNADIYCQYPLEKLINQPFELAHLILVPNPEHHPEGDFHLQANQLLTRFAQPKYTYSGLGMYHPKLFINLPVGRIPLAPVLEFGMCKDSISGELYKGDWFDIGTPERLAQLEQHLA